MGFNSGFKGLMYLSRLFGCPKSSQRDFPSSGISLFGTKIISRCFACDPITKRQSAAWVGETSPRPKKLRFQKSRVKTMLVIFFDWQGVIHKEFVPEGETVNVVYCKGVMERLVNRIWRVRPGMCESGDWFLLHDNAPPTTRQSSSSFWPNEKWLCSTTLRIRQF